MNNVIKCAFKWFQWEIKRKGNGFTEKSYKTMMMAVTKDAFLRLISVILSIHSDLPFLPERINISVICMKRKTMSNLRRTFLS